MYIPQRQDKHKTETRRSGFLVLDSMSSFTKQGICQDDSMSFFLKQELGQTDSTYSLQKRSQTRLHELGQVIQNGKYLLQFNLREMFTKYCFAPKPNMAKPHTHHSEIRAENKPTIVNCRFFIPDQSDSCKSNKIAVVSFEADNLIEKISVHIYIVKQRLILKKVVLGRNVADHTFTCFYDIIVSNHETFQGTLAYNRCCKVVQGHTLTQITYSSYEMFHGQNVS